MKNGIFQLDYNKMTLDGKDIQLEDLIVLLDKWHYRHPEDKHIENVLSFWAYGRDPKNPMFTKHGDK